MFGSGAMPVVVPADQDAVRSNLNAARMFSMTVHQSYGCDREFRSIRGASDGEAERSVMEPMD